MRIKGGERMPKFVELAIDGVIHESEIFGAAMPREHQDKTQGEADNPEDDATTTGSCRA